MGGKGNLLYVVLAVIISYVMFCTSFSYGRIIKAIVLICGIVLPGVRYLYIAYGYSDFFRAIFHRLFIAYTEVIGATVSFVDMYGNLNFRTLPNVRGLLSHVPVILESRMHLFMTQFEGSWPVPAVAEGYVNLGFLGFVFMGFLGFGTVVFLEEIFYRLANNIGNKVLQVHCSILVMYLAIHSYFSSFLSITYLALYVFLFLCYKIIFSAFKRVV
jgi:hypothetical protein